MQDHLGCPIRLIHNWQTPLAYDAFGVMTTGMTPNVKQPFGFTGYMHEDVAGMYYAQARYYSPQIGRFGAEDTVRDGANWYGYCHGNPLRFVDKDGLTAIVGTRGCDWIGAGEAMPAWSFSLPYRGASPMSQELIDVRGDNWIGAGEAMPARSSPARRTPELPYHYLAPPNAMNSYMGTSHGTPIYSTGQMVYAPQWSPSPMRDLNLPTGYDRCGSAIWDPSTMVSVPQREPIDWWSVEQSLMVLVGVADIISGWELASSGAPVFLIGGLMVLAPVPGARPLAFMVAGHGAIELGLGIYSIGSGISTIFQAIFNPPERACPCADEAFGGGNWRACHRPSDSNGSRGGFSIGGEGGSPRGNFGGRP